MTETIPSPLGNVIAIDDERIKNHRDRVVWGKRGGDVERAPKPYGDPMPVLAARQRRA